MPEENIDKVEQGKSCRRIKLLSNYPGALLTFFATGIFWCYLAFLVLPLHQKMLADLSKDSVEKIIGSIYNSLQMLYSVSGHMVDYSLLLPILIIAPIIYFEKICKDPREICLKKQKTVMYSINSICILFTAISYALSCLIILYFAY